MSVYKYLGLELKDSGIVSQAVKIRHARGVREKLASRRILKYILPTPLRAMLACSFYSSKATYALPLIAPMAKVAMDEWDKLQRVKTKLTFNLSEKTSTERLAKATMEPSPTMLLRERLLRLQAKLLRFQVQLHPSALAFLQQTRDLGQGKAEAMAARKYRVDAKNVAVYQTMISKGLLRNLLRARAATLCNSRHFPRGPVQCPEDDQMLSIHHVIGNCALLSQWRTEAARLLRCSEDRILQTLGSRDILRRESRTLPEHLLKLEAICQPLGAIQKAASEGQRAWVVPPIQLPERAPRVHPQKRYNEPADAPGWVDPRAGAGTEHVPFGPRPLPRQAQLPWARRRE